MDALLDRYEIVREVSAGGPARVLQAVDREQGRPVALKVYELADADEAARLRAEAHVLLGLAPHPGLPVVRVDFVARDQYVIVMDWVDGTDLQSLVDDSDEGRLPLGMVIDVVTQAATALDHLHSHDPVVVHGDVKPANLVRRPDGSVVLVDFGMAAEADPARIGTRGFVAPEVAAGDKPGPPADVYGLAATAVALLTGAAPSGDEVVPADLGPATGGAIASALRRALSTDPARRPASAGELADALRAGRDGALPTGVVTILAAEMADATAQWDQFPTEMPAVSARLGDLVTAVVERAGGRFAARADGHRVVAVFRHVSTAALAALDLHERVAAESWPRGMRVALRVAIEVGETDLRDGALHGAVLERAAWMRTVAAPGMTVTSRATGELVSDRLADDVRVVPIGELASRDGGKPHPLFAVVAADDPSEPPSLVSPALRPSAATAETAVTAVRVVDPVAAMPVPTARRRIVVDAAQTGPALAGYAVCGLAVIYLVVLAPELGLATVALVVAVLAGAFGVAATAVGTRLGVAADRERVEGERARLELAARASNELEETERTRRALGDGFAAVDADDARRVLDELVGAYEAVRRSVPTDGARGSGVATLIPRLADETYAQGLSALSDALEGLSVASDRELARLRAAIDDAAERQVALEGRGESGAKDAQRVEMYSARRERLRQVRVLADELVFQAERCGEVLRDARVEITAVRIGSAEHRVDAVVETMQSNLDRVREVQDAFRRLER